MQEEQTGRHEAAWVLIAKYLAGDCTPGESTQLDTWLAADPVLQRDMEQLLAANRYVAGTCSSAEQWNSTASWEALMPRLQIQNPTVIQPATALFPSRPAAGDRKYDRSVKAWRPVWTVSTGVVLGFLAILLGWRHGFPHFGAHGTGPVSAYVTGRGERATITLPDGNTAALNVASRLEVPANYMAGNHTVRLYGEALFIISHHDGVPFTVLAGSTSARVLGTGFVVRRYTTDTSTMVAVRDGKVAVQRAGVIRPVVLTANQQVRVSDAGSIYERLASPAQFSFAEGRLLISDLSLQQAIPELDRWYDVDIRLADQSLATRRITVECADGSLTDLTAILEMTLNLRVMRDGRTLTLSSR